MTRQISRIDAMRPGEIDDIPFDFSADLTSGETISSAPVIAEWNEGEADASAQSIVTGSPVVGNVVDGVFTANAAGGFVLQRITAHSTDTAYYLACTVTLSSGRKLTAAAILPVRKL